jgi:hypothetical protein
LGPSCAGCQALAEESPYAPPRAELVGSDALQEGETWTYPLAFKGTLGFYPRVELRDAHQRLLWLSEMKPIQRRIPLQTKREGVVLDYEARLDSAWHQRWVFRNRETGEDVGALTRSGGCLPGAFTLWPAWIGAGSSGARLWVRHRGFSIGTWVARVQPQSDLARTGLQDPEGLGVEEAAALQRTALLTLHAREGAPAFLRVRRERGAFQRNFVLERLEGEVDPDLELLAQQVVFLLLCVGLG